MKDYNEPRTVLCVFGDSRQGTYSYSDGNTSVTVNDYFHGADNPDWRKDIKNNEQAGTPVTARLDSVEFSYQPSKARYYNGGTECLTYRHNALPIGLGFVPWNADLVNEAEADAWNNLMKSVRKTQSSYEGMVFLGELGQTTAMLRNPLKSIVDALSHLMKDPKVRKSIRKSLDNKVALGKGSSGQSSFKDNPILNGKTAAELILQWNFGIVPLYNDLQGMIVAAKAIPLSGKTRVRGYGEKMYEYTSDIGVSVAGVMPVTGTSTISQHVQVAYTAGITEEVVAPDALQRMWDRGSFSLSSIAPSLYELIPWSFLLDYVSNAGDILSAVCTSRRNVRWIIRSEVRTQRVHSMHTPLQDPKYDLYQQGYASFTTTVRTFTRTLVPVDVTVFPEFYLETPQHVRQYVNIAALARLLFR